MFPWRPNPSLTAVRCLLTYLRAYTADLTEKTSRVTDGRFSLPAPPPVETAASGWTDSSPPRFSWRLSGPPQPAAFPSEECGQIMILIEKRRGVAAPSASHLQLLCSLLQKPLCGSELLDGLVQLIHSQVLLLHLPLQLVSLQDQILHLRVSRESLLFRPGLLFPQLNVALPDRRRR